MTKPIPNFINVFEHKLEKLKHNIKNEIQKPKKERSKKSLKELVHEANQLKKMIKQIKNEDVKYCPHCKEKI